LLHCNIFTKNISQEHPDSEKAESKKAREWRAIYGTARLAVMRRKALIARKRQRIDHPVK
jgi:hypothetical protein